LEKKQKIERTENANRFIKAISNCGRRFFWSEEFERVSRFELAENGRLYFHDKYTGVRLPLSHKYGHKWQANFSDGGTLKNLVEHLADYIQTGKPISDCYALGPWADWVGNNGDPWGYGEDMKKIRRAASELGIYKALPEKERKSN